MPYTVERKARVIDKIKFADPGDELDASLHPLTPFVREHRTNLDKLEAEIDGRAIVTPKDEQYVNIYNNFFLAAFANFYLGDKVAAPPKLVVSNEYTGVITVPPVKESKLATELAPAEAAALFVRRQVLGLLNPGFNKDANLEPSDLFHYNSDEKAFYKNIDGYLGPFLKEGKLVFDSTELDRQINALSKTDKEIDEFIDDLLKSSVIAIAERYSSKEEKEKLGKNILLKLIQNLFPDYTSNQAGRYLDVLK